MKIRRWRILLVSCLWFNLITPTRHMKNEDGGGGVLGREKRKLLLGVMISFIFLLKSDLSLGTLLWKSEEQTSTFYFLLILTFRLHNLKLQQESLKWSWVGIAYPHNLIGHIFPSAAMVNTMSQIIPPIIRLCFIQASSSLLTNIECNCLRQLPVRVQLLLTIGGLQKRTSLG